MNIIFLGDIIGMPGIDLLRKYLPELIESYSADVVIANGENGSNGKGLRDNTAKAFFKEGVNVITSGNHIWDKAQHLSSLDYDARVLRPLNYPPGTRGNGYYIHELENGSKLAVVNLQGRVFMPQTDCPFRSAEWVLSRIQPVTPNILVDFHAEATAEKQALAVTLDGKISAFVGTHTHVQTADERISESGMAYITDVGMTGPFDTIIGMNTETAVNRFRKGIPYPYEIGQGKNGINGVFIEINEKNGKALKIERIRFFEEN